MDEWVVVGATLIGGLAVIIVVARTFFFGNRTRYGYQIPGADAGGRGFRSRESAIEGAGRAIDEMTEIEWRQTS